MKREIYFDNAATTRPYDEVIEVANERMIQYYNPSAIYDKAIAISKQIESVRRKILQVLAAEKGTIIFTSGGTESSNLAIQNMPKGSSIITTSYEHSATLNAMQKMQEDCKIIRISPREGKIFVEDIIAAVDENTSLVSVMQVNNETGHLLDIQWLGKEIKKKNPKIKFHVDAVQSFLKMPIDVDTAQVAFLSISGHKIHGLKGCGALYVRNPEKIKPILFGGGQEMGLRSGTENTIGIAAFGKAVEIGAENLNEYRAHLDSLKKYFLEKLMGISNIQINSPSEGAPHILNISFLGVPSEILLHSLEAEGIYVSAGSACSAKKKGSHVLSELGLSDEAKKSAIRFSFSHFNSIEDIEIAAPIIEKNVREIRKITKYKG